MTDGFVPLKVADFFSPVDSSGGLFLSSGRKTSSRLKSLQIVCSQTMFYVVLLMPMTRFLESAGSAAKRIQVITFSKIRVSPWLGLCEIG